MKGAVNPSERGPKSRAGFLERRTVSFNIPNEPMTKELLPTKWTDYGQITPAKSEQSQRPPKHTSSGSKNNS